MSKNKVNSEAEEPIDGENIGANPSAESPESAETMANTSETESLDADAQLQQ